MGEEKANMAQGASRKNHGAAPILVGWLVLTQPLRWLPTANQWGRTHLAAGCSHDRAKHKTTHSSQFTKI